MRIVPWSVAVNEGSASPGREFLTFVGLLTLSPQRLVRISFVRVAARRRAHILAMGSSALMASRQVQATSQAIPLLGPPAPG
jgi:hypothetical protein